MNPSFINYRIGKLQKRLEILAYKQRNYFKRKGKNSEKLDKEVTQYISIINELRKELAKRS